VILVVPLGRANLVALEVVLGAIIVKSVTGNVLFPTGLVAAI
jgi:hypothetical protein